jgi:3-deoxy-7-phosphoheptulonate synthase / chorismate mutase
MAETSIESLRKEIDSINLQLLDLLSKRAEFASQIGKLQTTQGMTLYDPQREADMLTALQMANKGPFSNTTIIALFKEIFKASLALEEKEARAKIVVQRKTPDQNTVIDVNGVKIGDGSFQIVAGACAIESFDQMDAVGEVLAEQGVKIMRGMAYKPRSSPYDFQGMGEEGLKIARKVADKYGMVVVSEIMDASQIPMFQDYVDIFWVGARNMQNSYLLKALGKIKQPVILKRHFAATLKELLYSAEYIASGGNTNIIFIERGIRTFNEEVRNTLDIGAVPLLKMESHLPVIVDISHSAGRRDLAIPFGRIAKASGADGLMVEVHPNPPVAMSDAKQQLYFDQFRALMKEVNAVVKPEKAY